MVLDGSSGAARMTLPTKVFAGFLVGGGVLAWAWEPVALAAVLVLAGFTWRKGKAIFNAR